MHAAPLPSVASLPPDFIHRFGIILLGLAGVVARRFLKDPRRGALIIPLCTRLTRAVHHLRQRLSRLAAGCLPYRRRTPPARPRIAGPRRPSAFPAGRAWLVGALGHEAAAYASQLQSLLAEPGAELLAQDPAAARILRPIRHMLGLSAPRKPRVTTRAAIPRARPPRLPPVAWAVDPAERAPLPWWLPPRRLRTG